MKTRNETQNQNHLKTSKRKREAPEQWRVLLNELRRLKVFFFVCFLFKHLTRDNVKWKKRAASNIACECDHRSSSSVAEHVCMHEAQAGGRRRTAVVASLWGCG